VRKSDWKGREDVTGLPLVTIDSETARDFDDAVYCQRKGKGFRLVVAIADVSHYVTAGGALDGDALCARQLRLFSAARDSDAPGKDFQWPVLAESAGRALCMVCDMEIAGSGAIGATASIRRSCSPTRG
jgi:ribonuclease R